MLLRLRAALNYKGVHIKVFTEQGALHGCGQVCHTFWQRAGGGGSAGANRGFGVAHAFAAQSCHAMHADLSPSGAHVSRHGCYSRTRARCPAALQVVNTIEAAHPDKPRPQLPADVTALTEVRKDVQVVPTQTGSALVRHKSRSCQSLLVRNECAVVASAGISGACLVPPPRRWLARHTLKLDSA